MAGDQQEVKGVLSASRALRAAVLAQTGDGESEVLLAEIKETPMARLLHMSLHHRRRRGAETLRQLIGVTVWNLRLRRLRVGIGFGGYCEFDQPPFLRN